MLYFEQHGPQPRFVELRCQGLEVVVRSGALGQSGRRRSVSFRSMGEGEAWRVRQAQRLERRGYWPGHHQPELLALLREQPEDPRVYRVYADWLLERRDVRGELIVAQLAGDGPRSAALLHAHPLELLPGWWAEQGLELAWSMGFVHTVRVTASSFWRTRVEDTLKRLFQHPSTHLVREFVVPAPVLSYFHRACAGITPPTLQSVRASGSP